MVLPSVLTLGALAAGTGDHSNVALQAEPAVSGKGLGFAPWAFLTRGWEKEAEAPWAMDPAKLVVIVSTQRGASTEAAEMLGSTHPCSASFNELLARPQFPDGYDRYRSDKTLQDYVGIEKLRFSEAPLFQDLFKSAAEVRRNFCASRPKEILDVCGDTCVTVLKMHLNEEAMLRDANDPAWLELITAPGVRAALIERDERDTFCSIERAQKSGDWGHSPSEHSASQNAARESIPCNPNTRKADKFVKEVQDRFEQTRAALTKNNRTWLELPFDEFIQDTTASQKRLYDLAGLQMPPPSWQETCALPWCAKYTWPA